MPQGKAMDQETRNLLNRWKSIQGHARAVEKMLEGDAYCVDVLKQTLAIQGAIEKVNAGVLERHLKTCVTTAIASDDPAEREQVIAELMDVFKGTGPPTTRGLGRRGHPARGRPLERRRGDAARPRER